MVNEDREPAGAKRDEGMAGGGAGSRGGERVREIPAHHGGDAEQKQRDREREMQAEMNRNRPKQ